MERIHLGAEFLHRLQGRFKVHAQFALVRFMSDLELSGSRAFRKSALTLVCFEGDSIQTGRLLGVLQFTVSVYRQAIVSSILISPEVIEREAHLAKKVVRTLLADLWMMNEMLLSIVVSNNHCQPFVSQYVAQQASSGVLLPVLDDADLLLMKLVPATSSPLQISFRRVSYSDGGERW